MNRQTTNRDWVSPPVIARELGINAGKVIEWITSGELKAVNLSNRTRPRWRISREDFDDFLRRRSNADHRKEPSPRAKRRKAVKEWV